MLVPWRVRVEVLFFGASKTSWSSCYGNNFYREMKYCACCNSKTSKNTSCWYVAVCSHLCRGRARIIPQYPPIQMLTKGLRFAVHMVNHNMKSTWLLSIFYVSVGMALKVQDLSGLSSYPAIHLESDTLLTLCWPWHPDRRAVMGILPEGVQVALELPLFHQAPPSQRGAKIASSEKLQAPLGKQAGYAVQWTSGGLCRLL